MTFVNVGAKVDGVRPKTKKALREALKADPRSVVFDNTSDMGPQLVGINGANVPVEYTLQVVGPDPYTKRNWYASVKNGPVIT